MSNDASASPVPVPRRGATAALVVFRLAALFTFLTVAMGSVVSATDSGAACPTWPGCRSGDLAPQWAMSPVIEFTHRVVAILAGPLVLAAVVLTRRLSSRDPRVRLLPWVALAGAIAAGTFGRLVVLKGVPAWMGAIDLCCALTAMTVMAVAAVLAGRRPARPPVPPAGGTVRVSRAAGATVCVLIVMHVTGILTAGPRSYTRTVGWPFWRLIASDLHPWLQVVRLVLAILAAVLLAGTAVLAMRHARLRAFGLAAAALFATEMLLGLIIRTGGLHTGVAVAYAVVAVALLWCMGLLTAATMTAGPVPAAAPPTPPAPADGERDEELAGSGQR